MGRNHRRPEGTPASVGQSEVNAMADEALRQSHSQAILNLSLDLAKKHYGDLLD